MDPSGNQLFSRALSELGIFQIERMYQLGDGRIYVKCMEKDGSTLLDVLCEVEPATGDISQVGINVSDLFYGAYI